MDINQLLQKNSFAVNELIRQENIVAPTMRQAIAVGYREHGTPFLLKVFNAVQENEISNFSDEMGPEPPAGSYVNSEGITVVPSQGSSFWGVWSNLLSYASQTGDTVNKLRNDIAGTGEAQQQKYYNEGSKYTVMYIVAAIVVLAIILILIFKK